MSIFHSACFSLELNAQCQECVFTIVSPEDRLQFGPGATTLPSSSVTKYIFVQVSNIFLSNHVEIKVTIERDSDGKFGISIRKGSNVIDYISPGTPAALHGGINAGDMIIEINSIPVDEKPDVIELIDNNACQTLHLVIRKKGMLNCLKHVF